MTLTSLLPEDSLAIALSLTFLMALTEAAICDWRHFQIPNHVSLVLCAMFVIVAALNRFSWSEWLQHAGAAVALLVTGYLLFAARLWGGGDAKLIPSVGLWIGIAGLPRFLLVMSMAGCALSLFMLATRLRLPFGHAEPSAWRTRLAASRHVPYGVAIAIGGADWWARTVLATVSP